jgi:hypothetical protein
MVKDDDFRKDSYDHRCCRQYNCRLHTDRFNLRTAVFTALPWGFMTGADIAVEQTTRRVCERLGILYEEYLGSLTGKFVVVTLRNSNDDIIIRMLKQES